MPHSDALRAVPRARREASAAAAGLATALVATLWLLAALPGCAGEDSPAGPDTGDLSGRVVLNLTTEPLAGVTVTCVGQQRITGPDGLFVFADLPVGTLELQAQKADYRPLSWTFELGESAFLGVALVPVDSTADIGGTVAHRLDGPIAGAEVRCAGRTVVTGGNGAWALADVPLGRHDVLVSHPFYLPLATPLVAAHSRETLALTLRRRVNHVLPVTKDAEVRRTLADLQTNYGAAPLAAAGASTKSEALLAMPDQRALAAVVVTVESAILRLHVRRQFPGELPADAPSCLQVRIVGERWGELSVTGADSLGEDRLAPLFDLTAPDCLAPLDGTWRPLDLDVTDHVAEILAGSPHYGLLFSHAVPAGSAESGGVAIATRENPEEAARPLLILQGAI